MGNLQVKTKIDVKGIMNNLQNARIKIGFPEESHETLSHHEGVTALHKAVRNNYGIGVPKRPFMQVAFYQNKEKYDKIVLKSFSKIEDIDLPTILNKIGLVASNDVKNAIIALRSPPNAQSTIDEKGSSNPLVDSGHLVQSVTWQIIKD